MNVGECIHSLPDKIFIKHETEHFGSILNYGLENTGFFKLILIPTGMNVLDSIMGLYYTLFISRLREA